MKTGPKILLIDIETKPLLAYVWSIWEQNVGLNQIKDEWSIISFAAKRLGQDEIIYKDVRRNPLSGDCQLLLAQAWRLIDWADILITHNGKAFDLKKLYAKFILNGFKPPSPVRHIDTLAIAKKHFAFTSNKMEYLSDKLCTQKKSQHSKFQGFTLWTECLKGNTEAWDELKTYNIQDVLVLEELYTKLYPWDNGINFNAYTPADKPTACHCGSTEFKKKGFQLSNTSKFQRYRCKRCGAHHVERVNLLEKEKRQNVFMG